MDISELQRDVLELDRYARQLREEAVFQLRTALRQVGGRWNFRGKKPLVLNQKADSIEETEMGIRFNMARGSKMSWYGINKVPTKSLVYSLVNILGTEVLKKGQEEGQGNDDGDLPEDLEDAAST